MSIWFDRCGIVIQFFAFWLIAPEFIGGANMNKFGKSLAQFLSTTGFVLLSSGVLVLAWSLAFLDGLHWFHRASIALLISSIVIVPKLLLYRKFHQLWLPKLLDHLSRDEHFRRVLALIGCALFTLGTIFQLLGTV